MNSIRAKLTIENIGRLDITDRRSLEMAINMLRYARSKLQIKYRCDTCNANHLDEFYIIEHRKEKIVQEDWQIPDQINAYCPDCFEKVAKS